MKKVLFVTLFCAGGLFAVSVNDLAPDFDNSIADDGFWDTTGHLPVEVVVAASDKNEFDTLESINSGQDKGAILAFDSRESTSDVSDGIARFTSKPMGTIINLR